MSDGTCTCFGEITEADIRAVDEIIEKKRNDPGPLIPVLNEVQERLGYLPRYIQARIAEKLNIPASDVYSVVTFYALFSTKPKGKYRIGVCKGTACYVKGADEILSKIEELLGIKAGDTTNDGNFSLEVMRCIGACGLGPVITIDEDIITRLKPEKIKEILDKYR